LNMRDTVIRVENISKEYRLGTISHGTLYRDLQSWTAKLLGKEDPNSKIASAGCSVKNGIFKALDDIFFEVKKGEILGIIGRNGAGKSTLLKIISKVTSPSKGVIKIKGRVASLLEVGTGFHPELTGRENIFLNGAILGMTKKEISRKFDEIVDFAEIEAFIDTPVKRYSSGMYVRLAFAVAANLEPEILIIDEVLAVGDIGFQKKCLGKMEEVSTQHGRTILFVSHNMEAVSTLCTKALILQSGKITYEGNVHVALDTYSELNRRTGISVNNCFSRGGSGGVKIVKVFTASAGQGNRTKILSGGSMCINIELKMDPQYQGKNINIGIGVDTISGKRLFTNVSSWEGDEVVIKKDSAMIGCYIENVALIPGTYLVSVSAVFQTDTLDCAVHCAEFNVHACNTEFYVPREKDHGEIYVPCKFSVLPSTVIKRNL